MGKLIKNSDQCPNCGSHSGHKIYDTNEHCFSCGLHKSYEPKTFIVRERRTPQFIWNGGLPGDCIKDGIPLDYEKWIGLYFSSWDEVGDIYWSPSMWRLVFPIYHEGVLKCFQARSVDDQPKWITYSPEYKWGKRYPFIQQKEKDAPFVLVEDIISALKVGLAYPNVIALLGCSINFPLCNFLSSLSDRFIIWLDGDAAGIKGTDKLIHTLTPVSKYLSTIRTTNDPKCYSKERVKELIDEKLHPLLLRKQEIAHIFHKRIQESIDNKDNYR